MCKHEVTKARVSVPLREYDAVLAFARGHQGLTYDRFDAAIVRDVNLFALEEQFDFTALRENLDHIIGVLPVFKRIMSRPIIRLKDLEDVLPVEAVRLVNNRTVVHASVHSELWENIGENGVRPKKLMTVEHQDEYVIYENLVVARAMNTTLAYVSKNIRSLQNLLYTDRNMSFNLLERANHLSYFLAIGKLHIGYVRDYDKHRSDAEACLDKLLFIDRVLRSRLNCLLYRKCGDYSKELPLKKTNIFRNQKDYHRIYLLMKWFEERQIGYDCSEEQGQSVSDEAYYAYCSAMCLFSAGHFNFRFEDEQQIDLLMPRQDARFLKWRLRVEGICVQDRRVILLTFLKDLPYRVVLIPCADILQGSKAQNEIKEQIAAEEYHLLTPDDAVGAKCISIFDIESFRRLQQIFLRAMIYADQAREDCPFCGNGMTVLYKNEKETCACPVCRTQIKTLRCEESGKEYYATDIGNFSPAVSADAQHRGSDPYLFGRLAESMLHFRNVTDIDQEGRPLCPFCGVKHF